MCVDTKELIQMGSAAAEERWMIGTESSARWVTRLSCATFHPQSIVPLVFWSPCFVLFSQPLVLVLFGSHDMFTGIFRQFLWLWWCLGVAYKDQEGRHHSYISVHGTVTYKPRTNRIYRKLIFIPFNKRILRTF